MAMRKKSDDEKAARIEAEKIVDRFLDVLMSGDDEIARESRSVIGALVDFKGEIPRSSGFSGFCKLAGKVDRMKRWGSQHLLACMIMRSLSGRQREALAVDRAIRGRLRAAADPFKPEKVISEKWTDERCAAELRCSVTAFNTRVSDGYGKIEADLAAGRTIKAA